MRDRHIPRVCPVCDSPMARRENACWHCHTVWGETARRPEAAEAAPAAERRPEVLVAGPA